VLFIGVLYHLRDPILALERVASVTRHMLVVETEADLVGFRRPAAAFYPGGEVNDDPTNWWGPNIAAVEGMLRAVGFTETRVVSRYNRAMRLARAVRLSRQGRERLPLRALLQRDRVVVHGLR
jgi:tRNA (mo5U34)-methyltransferase